jgi:hypothetical protein
MNASPTSRDTAAALREAGVRSVLEVGTTAMTMQSPGSTSESPLRPTSSSRSTPRPGPCESVRVAPGNRCSLPPLRMGWLPRAAQRRRSAWWDICWEGTRPARQCVWLQFRPCEVVRRCHAGGRCHHGVGGVASGSVLGTARRQGRIRCDHGSDRRPLHGEPDLRRRDLLRRRRRGQRARRLRGMGAVAAGVIHDIARAAAPASGGSPARTHPRAARRLCPICQPRSRHRSPGPTRRRARRGRVAARHRRRPPVRPHREDPGRPRRTDAGRQRRGLARVARG